VKSNQVLLLENQELHRRLQEREELLAKSHKAEDALKDECDFNSALLDTLGALVVVLDREGRIIRFNRACEQTTGCLFQEVQGKPFFDLFLLPEEVQGVKEVFQKLNTGAFPNTHVNHWLTRDGGRRLISWSNTALTDKQGQVAHIIGTGIDISARQQAEKAVKQSEARERDRASELQGVLDAVPTPIVMALGPDARYITGNLAAYDLLHLLPGSNFSKTAPEDERPGYKAMKNGWELPVQELPMQRAIAGQTVRDFEYDLILEDGAIRHISANAVPLLDEAGRPRGAVAAFIDLTARKRGHEALRRARDELEERVKERTAQLQRQAELIQDLYNNAPCGYHSLDKEGRFVQVNDTELTWLGYKREEMLGGMKFSDILTAESLATFQKNFPSFLERGWARDFEYDLICKDGTILPVSLSATAIKDEAGGYLMSRGTIFDITERRRADEALQESEKKLRYLASRLLTAQEDVRKRIAWELHDDLGQSLTALKLQIRALHQRFPAEISEVEGENEAMLNYINEIVEKVRSISYNLRPQVLDLGLTAALNSLLREFQMDQNMELSTDICPMDGLFSSEEQVGIYRVFQEALTNIVKHAQATRVALTAKKQGGLMAFQINDKGQGFDLKGVQSPGAKDQRLGLATMEERVRLLGESLKVSSVKGTGTSVSFTIPISSPQKAVD